MRERGVEWVSRGLFSRTLTNVSINSVPHISLNVPCLPLPTLLHGLPYQFLLPLPLFILTLYLYFLSNFTPLVALCFSPSSATSQTLPPPSLCLPVSLLVCQSNVSPSLYVDLTFFVPSLSSPLSPYLSPHPPLCSDE